MKTLYQLFVQVIERILMPDPGISLLICLLRNGFQKISFAPTDLFVPTPLEAGGTIYSTVFLLFSQFWPIDIFIVES